jgi:hypothetical protein
MLTSSARPQPVRWSLHQPIVLTLAVVAVVLATVIPLAFGAEVDAVYAIASKVVLCAFAVALLTGFGWWARTGFLALPARRDLVWLAPPALLVSGMVVATIAAGPAPIDPGLMSRSASSRWAPASGRGAVPRRAPRGHRPWGLLGLIGSAVAFSLIHVAGLAGGATLEATLAQVLMIGLPWGIAFGALRLIGRSIWPLIVIHALNNFAAFLTTGAWANATADPQTFVVAAVLQLAFLLVLIAYSIWFLWRPPRQR